MKNNYKKRVIKSALAAMAVCVSLITVSCHDDGPSKDISECSIFPLQAGDTISGIAYGDPFIFYILSSNTLQTDLAGGGRRDDGPIDFSSKLSQNGCSLEIQLTPNLDAKIARLNVDLENPESVIRRIMSGEIILRETSPRISNVTVHIHDEYNLPVEPNLGSENPSGSITGYHLELTSLVLNSKTGEMEYIGRCVEILTSDTTDFEAFLGAETTGSAIFQYTFERPGLQN